MNRVEQMKKIQNEALELFTKKNIDYSTIQSASFERGAKDASIRCWLPEQTRSKSQRPCARAHTYSHSCWSCCMHARSPCTFQPQVDMLGIHSRSCFAACSCRFYACFEIGYISSSAPSNASCMLHLAMAYTCDPSVDFGSSGYLCSRD